MARLGGMSTESFSSARECLSAASVGLAAILRDQKTMHGSSRSTVVLGFSSQTTPAAARSLSNSPARSLANSPIESSGFLESDDADDHKEEDICGAALRESRNSQSLKESLGLSHSVSQGFDIRNHGYDTMCRHGFSRSHTQPQTLMHTNQKRNSRAFHDVSKQQMLYAVDGSRSTQHLFVDKGAGLSDSIVTSSSLKRLSPLSKVSDSQQFPIPAQKAASSPTWTIPRARRCTHRGATHDSSEHQSVPVNVPSWSAMGTPPASGVGSRNGMEKFGEDDSKRLPPHELLAREYAESPRMTSSVCEGHGRTLKGRDMRRVRNAVWRHSDFAD